MCTLTPVSSKDSFREPLLTAYTSNLLAGPEAVRQRAQQTATLAVALAAAIVAAGALGVFSQRPLWVQALGVSALVLWIASGLVYFRIVAGIQAARLAAPLPSEEQFLRAIVAMFGREREIAARRLSRAALLTGAALVVTTAAVVTALFVDKQPERTTSQVVLTHVGQMVVGDACGLTVPSNVNAEVVESELDSFYIELRLAPGACGANETTVRVRRDAILGIRALK
jgi:hypothetical protein